MGNGDAKSLDCEGPYAIFYTVETSSNNSPHAVLCKHCLDAVHASVYAEEPELVELPPESIMELPLDTAESVNADAIPEI